MILRHILKTACVCATFLLCATMANAYVPSYYSANSKLKSGHWVKVKVSELGMQEITHDQLRQWGFSDPSKVCVYGYGGTQLTNNKFEDKFPDDLPAQPVYYTTDKIIFYGEPDYKVSLGSNSYKVDVSRNMYSNYGYYMLSDYQPSASAIPSAAKYNLSNIINREFHYNILYTEKELDNPGSAGAFFFDKSLLESPKSYSFNITKPYVITNEDAGMRYSFAAKVPQYTSLMVDFNQPDSLITKAKHNAVIPSTLSSQYYYTQTGEMNFKLLDSDTTYSFYFTIPSEANATYAAIDYVYVSYPRQNNFENESQMRMHFIDPNQNTNFTISNGNSNVQVWNISDPRNIFPHAIKYSESSKNIIGSFDKTYKYSSTGNACLIAFDPTKTMHKVELAEIVENQNLHNAPVPDMVIITNNLCEPYAQQVAQAHRDYQNLDVLVINQTQIFNEFSSGTPCAMAYRRFLKMFYDRNKTKLKYLLLFGEGSWDNRGKIYPKEDRLLTYQAEVVDDARSAAKAFCGDSYFGMLNDDFDPDYFYNNDVHIGIGRIPAQTQANAQAAVNKIINHLKNPPTAAVFNRALILADEGDSFGHIGQQEENVDSIMSISPSTTCTRAYSTLYPSTQYDAYEARNVITQALSQGQGFFSFAGHGGETSFTGKYLWSANAIKETDYSHSPFAMFATCDAFSFDRKDGGMAEQALYKENGGFIAIVAASRTVYMQHNQYINRAFTCELFNASENDLIGDVFRRARNKAATTIVDRTLGVNTMCYNLAGDPALPLYKPTLSIKTSAINNEEVAESKTHIINPLSKNTISGYITNSKGEIQDSFNGNITVSVFDAPTAYRIYKDNSVHIVDKPITYDGENFNSLEWVTNDSVGIVADEQLLAEVTVPVVNGKFEASIVTPISRCANSTNRISYFAISDDKATRANGYFNQISISNYDEATAVDDTKAPIIEECYINDPSFNNGDIVGSDFVLYATIDADESGINCSSGTIGGATTLTIDGNKSFPQVRTALIPQASGKSTLSFFISDIEDGKHTLTLSVSDNVGNHSSHSLNFVVLNQQVVTTLNVEEAPARTQATFNINHNFNDEPTGRLIIEDFNGNTVFSKNNCSFPYTWDLKDANGNLVDDGKYKAYVILNARNQYSNSEKIDVIVVK